MSLITEIQDDVKKVELWCEHEVLVIENKIAPAIVTTLEVMQKVWSSGAADFVGQVLDSLTKSGVPEQLITKIGDSLPVLIAGALDIATATPTTDAEKEALLTSIFTAWGITTDKSLVISTASAKLWDALDPDNGLTAFQRLQKIQDVFDSMKATTTAVVSNDPNVTGPEAKQELS
jgi:hypothetical protein